MMDPRDSKRRIINGKFILATCTFTGGSIWLMIWFLSVGLKSDHTLLEEASLESYFILTHVLQ